MRPPMFVLPRGWGPLWDGAGFGGIGGGEWKFAGHVRRGEEYELLLRPVGPLRVRCRGPSLRGGCGRPFLVARQEKHALSLPALSDRRESNVTKG